MSFYRRKLPHWQPQDAALFITWRLFGSMPRQDGGPHWLDNPNVAQIVSEAIYFGERELKLYDLIAFVVMPNHVQHPHSSGWGDADNHKDAEGVYCP